MNKIRIEQITLVARSIFYRFTHNIRNLFKIKNHSEATEWLEKRLLEAKIFNKGNVLFVTLYNFVYLLGIATFLRVVNLFKIEAILWMTLSKTLLPLCEQISRPSLFPLP